MTRGYRWRCYGVTGVGLLVLISGCSTVNRVVNMPFRAAENMLGSSERLVNDPNSFSRMLDRGVRSSSRMVPQASTFDGPLGSPLAAPISYQASFGSQDDTLGPTREWDMAVPLLP